MSEQGSVLPQAGDPLKDQQRSEGVSRQPVVVGQWKENPVVKRLGYSHGWKEPEGEG